MVGDAGGEVMHSSLAATAIAGRKRRHARTRPRASRSAQLIDGMVTHTRAAQVAFEFLARTVFFGDRSVDRDPFWFKVYTGHVQKGTCII